MAKRFLVSSVVVFGLLAAVWSAVPWNSGGSAHAAPAYPVVRPFTQPDGRVIELRLWGDEFVHGWDTLDGRAAVKSQQSGYWVYAALDATGNLAPTEAVVGRDAPPAPPGLRPTRAAIDSTRAGKGAPPFGQPIIAAPQPWAGPDTDYLFLMVQFTDLPCAFTAAQMQTNLFGGGATGPGDLDDYYREVSYGTLELQGAVSGCHALANSRSHYNKGPGTVRDLISEAVSAADPTVNFANFDNDGDTVVDTLGIIYAGGGPHDGCAVDNSPGGPAGDNLWPHLNFAIPVIAADGVIVAPYLIVPEATWAIANSLVCNQIQSIGIFAHEMGHSLGLPDLYDIDGNSAGVSIWSVMASHYGSTVTLADTPPHFDAWSKWFAGWLTPTAPPSLAVADVSLPAAEHSPSALRLRANPGGPDDWSLLGPGVGEYFLVDVPDQVPGAGHIDEARANNATQGHTAASHRLVDLEEADGLDELDGFGGADSGDPFPGSSGNTQFANTTTPHSKLYSGASSGVSLTGMLDDCSGTGVGGVADVPDAARAPVAASDSSGPGAGTLAGALGAVVVAGALALGGAGWRRRRVRRP